MDVSFHDECAFADWGPYTVRRESRYWAGWRCGLPIGWCRCCLFSPHHALFWGDKEAVTAVKEQPECHNETSEEGFGVFEKVEMISPAATIVSLLAKRDFASGLVKVGGYQLYGNNRTYANDLKTTKI
ncbi:hypothetical protein DdX_02572 [Ditylenchus destructor]|uniref:Uncharacterized protein n=1 Tax=Ditylenchus destructor TaxID=166010 RepID=A0AAD4NI06_9BILA|nr:hypothetical protein DdX_02572 [Ditylenchus destructor]